MKSLFCMKSLYCTVSFIDEDKIEELKTFLPTPDVLKGFVLYPEEFEKVLHMLIYNFNVFWLFQLLDN